MNISDIINLDRFLAAQSSTYDKALEEIQNGRKSSDWMWFVFPQIYGLDKSFHSMRYAIQSREEAICYLKHPILENRLNQITKAFYVLENKTAKQILGSPDDLKLKSCMTLFNMVQSENTIFREVLEKYFDGKQCL